MRVIRGGVLTVGAVLGVFIVAPTARAGGDPIFANGFEPCCSVGGTVSGYVGSGLRLQLMVGFDEVEQLELAPGSTRYRFAATVVPGQEIEVDVISHPAGQVCEQLRLSGKMPASDVVDADVSCTAALVWDEGAWDAADWQ